MKPTDIVSLIEGEPYISSVPVEPGLTNTEKESNSECIASELANTDKEVNGGRIVGLNSENTELNEGMIRFDIIFYVRMPSKSNTADNNATDNHKCGSTKIGTPKVRYSKQGNLLCEQNDFLAKGA